MSQIIKHIDEDFIVDLKVKVNLKSFSNHNGFSESQILNAIEEFKEEIQNELLHKISKTFQSEEFLNTVDFVTYDVEPIKTDVKNPSISEIRQAVAAYMNTEGCNCCEAYDHKENGEKLAILLDVEKYEDGSGYNWFKYTEKL